MPRRPDAAWRDGHPHQTAGMMLGKFISQRMTQLNLFDENGPRANNKALMLLMDKQTEGRSIWPGRASAGVANEARMLSPF
ncbi:hypothetical protein ACTV1I_001261 [Cronobacter dublinensis]|uniref:hypothetical protein n=1 Tax=Cronobacter dublinensis TaxID=413497 RepID=UPI0018F88C2E